MRRDDRMSGYFRRVIHSVRRKMGDADHHAQTIHLLNHGHAEGRQLAAHFVDTASVSKLVAAVVC